MSPEVDWEPALVRAKGLLLRVGRYGAGAPLLLITGIGAHIDMWAPFARLVADRELIAFDAPGTGLSERPRRPHGLVELIWLRVFAPVYRALPWPLRHRILRAMPGSHRRTWAPPPEPRAPAV